MRQLDRTVRLKSCPPISVSDLVEAITSKTSVKLLEHKVWGTYKDGEIQREATDLAPSPEAGSYHLAEEDDNYQRILRWQGDRGNLGGLYCIFSRGIMTISNAIETLFRC